jgi:hypothetical protein
MRPRAKAQDVNVLTPRVGETFEYAQPFQNVEWYKRETVLRNRESMSNSLIPIAE